MTPDEGGRPVEKVPDSVRAAALAAFAQRPVDLTVADLDPDGDTGGSAATPRTMSFSTAELRIEVSAGSGTIDLDAVSPGPLSVTCRLRNQESQGLQTSWITL
jgi:hypothetical protein